MPSFPERESSPPLRRRGRPAGKNRVPLTLNQRRDRNAQYERERRQETSLAIAELAAAIGCDSSMANVDVMATALAFITRHATVDEDDDIATLRRREGLLTMQIERLSQQLESPAPPTPPPEVDDVDATCARVRPHIFKKRKMERGEAVVSTAYWRSEETSTAVTGRPEVSSIATPSPSTSEDSSVHPVETQSQQSFLNPIQCKRRKVDRGEAVVSSASWCPEGTSTAVSGRPEVSSIDTPSPYTSEHSPVHPVETQSQQSFLNPIQCKRRKVGRGQAVPSSASWCPEGTSTAVSGRPEVSSIDTPSPSTSEESPVYPVDTLSHLFEWISENHENSSLAAISPSTSEDTQASPLDQGETLSHRLESVSGSSEDTSVATASIAFPSTSDYNPFDPVPMTGYPDQFAPSWPYLDDEQMFTFDGELNFDMSVENLIPPALLS